MSYEIVLNGEIADLNLTTNMRPMLDHVFSEGAITCWLDAIALPESWHHLHALLTITSERIGAMTLEELGSWDAPNGWGMGVDVMLWVDRFKALVAAIGERQGWDHECDVRVFA